MGVQGIKVPPARARLQLRSTVSAACVAACSVWMAGHAWAQVPAATAPAEGAVGELPTVNVQESANPEVTEGSGRYTPRVTSSATRLDLTLRETPQAVQVLTQQQLQDRGATNLRQAMEGAVGITVSNDTARPGFTARGFSVSNILIDGTPMLPVYQATPGVQGDGMVAYDRIEIVRGANGVVTGSGDPSATINMVRKRPTRSFQASVQAGVGSWGNWLTQADLSGPLMWQGRVRGRIALSKGDGDSYLDHKGRDTQALFATLETDLTPATTLRVGHHYDAFVLRGMGSASSVPLYHADGGLFNAPRSLSTSPGAWLLRHRVNNSFAELKHQFDNGWAVSGQLNHTVRHNFNVPVFKLNPPTYPDRNGNATTSYDYVPYPLRETQTAYDLNAKGPFALFGREHDLAVGAAGWRRKRTVNDWVLQPSAQPDSFYTRFSIWDMNWDAPRGYTLTGHPLDSFHSRQDGAYAMARWNLTDRLKLLTGARVTTWEQYTDNYNGVTGALVSARTGALKVKREVTPYAGLVFDVSPNISLYASYADVFKPQTYYDANDQAIAPIVGKSIELGAKGSFLDDRLNAAVTLFRVRQDNNALVDPAYADTYRTPGGNRPYLSSGKGNRVNGIELEVSGEVRPGWNLMAGYSHAPVKRADGTALDSNVPKDQFKLFTTYRLPGVARGWTVGGGVYWRSKINYATRRPTGAYAANGAPVTAVQDFVQKSAATVSALVRYQPTRQFSIDLGVENLFDKTYFQTLGTTTGIYGEPRRWWLNARYEF